MSVLVTGGAGYIGSHTCVELLNSGYSIVVADDLSNSSEESLKRIRKITGKDFTFYKTDITDRKSLELIFKKENIDSVIHFAGFKSVGESVAMPLKYYYNNLLGAINLCLIMKEKGVKKLVFSSSATVYGKTKKVPIEENASLSAINPYGSTKLMIEQILSNLYKSDKKWCIAVLRYFNPVGAHESGLIGEDPRGIPNNLFPNIAQAAAGKQKKLKIWGGDYPTRDGTGERDYIHVVDLAAGHIKALDKIYSSSGLMIYNLGTGKGYTVIETIKKFSQVSGKKIEYEIAQRRPGDTARGFADPTKAQKELGWRAEKELEEMCASLWNWQINNPNGYE